MCTIRRRRGRKRSLFKNEKKENSIKHVFRAVLLLLHRFRSVVVVVVVVAAIAAITTRFRRRPKTHDFFLTVARLSARESSPGCFSSPSPTLNTTPTLRPRSSRLSPSLSL